MSLPQEYNSNASLIGSGATTGIPAYQLYEKAKLINAQKEAERAASGIQTVASPKPGDIAGGSQYVVVNGKAINKANIGTPNITQTRPSILTKQGRIYADTPGITADQKRALDIFAAEHAATMNVAQQIAAERNAQNLSGVSRAEAQRIATTGTADERIASPGLGDKVAFTKANQDFINTALQTEEIRSNAARLAYAQKLIEEQTNTNQPLSSNATTQLDNLAEQLKNAPGQDQPVTNIIATTDQNGDVVSPRNIKLQVENALQTGTDPNLLTLDVVGTNGAAPNPESVAQAVDAAFADLIPGGLQGTTKTSVTPDGQVQINFSEALGPELKKQFGDIAVETLGKFFDLKGQGADAFFGQDGLKIAFDGQSAQLGGTPTDQATTGPTDFLSSLLNNPILLLVVLGIAVIIGGVLLFRK